ncbi:hypothetical protein KBC70_00365 [Candidatus Woesebacteria bacterium]|jgi:hypothetical protein|nr:hypothetical protein [Candidatus Woesebacteria bacterium]
MNETNSETHMLIGSLSNDLFRVATLSQRGSNQAAERFLLEAKRWAKPLLDKKIAPYIVDIALDISERDIHDIELESAERYLMYGILLQNYSLHYKV